MSTEPKIPVKQNGKSSPTNLQTCLILATVIVIILVCLAFLFAYPSTSAPKIKPIENLDYFTIRRNQQNLTGVQWEAYDREIKGKRVQWQGFISEIKPDITGENYVWVDMDNPMDGISDVYFAYPEDQSLAYSKGQPITFQGDYDGGITVFFFMIELEDAVILN